MVNKCQKPAAKTIRSGLNNKVIPLFNRSGSPIHDVAEMDIAIVQIQENREGTDDIDQYIKLLAFCYAIKQNHLRSVLKEKKGADSS